MTISHYFEPEQFRYRVGQAVCGRHGRAAQEHANDPTCQRCLRVLSERSALAVQIEREWEAEQAALKSSTPFST